MRQCSTELAKKIVQSDTGRKILGYVSPIYENGPIGLWLFQVIGSELDELKGWITEIAVQAYPQTVTWSIDIWEQQYGIKTNVEKSLKERRDLLVATVRERAPITPYKMAQMVAALCGGVQTRIQENIAANTFGIYLNTLPSNVDETEVRAAIDRCKPAHLIYEINYEQASLSKNYWGAMLRMMKKFEIRQVN
ncbi:MAG: DUF2313 domain-containing protein [Peptococcaceae bacterium]|jgi:hypothetical protein|nr:DUF2313 domain-containing protein [Peptococcaceae bacterium]